MTTSLIAKHANTAKTSKVTKLSIHTKQIIDKELPTHDAIMPIQSTVYQSPLVAHNIITDENLTINFKHGFHILMM